MIYTHKADSEGPGFNVAPLNYWMKLYSSYLGLGQPRLCKRGPLLLPLVLGLDPAAVLGLLTGVVVEQVDALAVHFHLEQTIDTGGRLGGELSGLDEGQDLGPPARGVDDPPGGGFHAAEAVGLEDQVPVGSWVGDFRPKNGRHGGLEGRAELELVEAREAARGVHDAVVVVHGEHEAAGEGMAVDPAGDDNI